LSNSLANRHSAVAVARDTATEWLECLSCRSHYEVAPIFFGCPRCANSGVSSPVEMRYKPRALAVTDKLSHGVWTWSSLLPPVAKEARVTLGEGATHLLPLPNFRPVFGPQLFLKNETTNPTWSWKDRGNAVSVSVARHFGFSDVVCISTGNHGNAMAAMASACGLRSKVFCNPNTPRLQLALMEAYGARVVLGGNAEAMVLDLVQRGTHFPCTVLSPRAGYSNPFGIEGFKTIAFEIWQQLGGVPDRVFVGVGSGDGVYGIWKGFRELRECGVADRVPRIIGCQTSGANSLVRAFARRERTIQALSSVSTVASSLAELAVGQQALDAVYDSNGAAIEVTDEEALESMRWITRRGIALEPSSAVPLAAMQKVQEAAGYESFAGEIWVSIGSGSAVKWPDDILRSLAIPEVLPPDQAVLKKTL
jgi:threonine synthase